MGELLGIRDMVRGTHSDCYETFAKDLTRVKTEVHNRGSVVDKRAKRMAEMEKVARKKSLSKQRGAARDYKAWESDQNTSQNVNHSPPSPECSPQQVPVEAVVLPDPQQPVVHEERSRADSSSSHSSADEPVANVWENRSVAQKAEWVFVEDDDMEPELGDSSVGAEDAACTSDAGESFSSSASSSSGPLDYCPVPLEEFVVPSRSKKREERWEIL